MSRFELLRYVEMFKSLFGDVTGLGFLKKIDQQQIEEINQIIEELDISLAKQEIYFEIIKMRGHLGDGVVVDYEDIAKNLFIRDVDSIRRIEADILLHLVEKKIISTNNLNNISRVSKEVSSFEMMSRPKQPLKSCDVFKSFFGLDGYERLSKKGIVEKYKTITERVDLALSPAIRRFKIRFSNMMEKKEKS